MKKYFLVIGCLSQSDLFREYKMERLKDKLKTYVQSDFYPFHMPGHKRHNLGDWMNYELDITEIDGFDNLHHPTGILQAAQDNAASIFGVKNSFFLVNGSTCGILASLWAARNLSEEIIIGRNCHKSIYHGCEVARFKTHYIYPSRTSLGINGDIVPDEVLFSMEQNPKAKVVFITSPTYDGVVSNIEKIASIVHEHNGILIVDCAHGAHFGMDEFFPKSPNSQGADVVIMSLHKTLPSPTQTAIMHLCSDRISKENLQEALDIFQTSSPSYLLMVGIQECLEYLKNNKSTLFRNYVDKLNTFYEKSAQLEQFKLSNVLKNKQEVYDLDLSKILIFPENGMDGPMLEQILREEYHLEMEMVAPNSVTALTSCMDSKEGFERLSQALQELEERGNLNQETKRDSFEKPDVIKGDKQMEIWEVTRMEEESLPIQETLNRISKSYLYLYPPGIPVLAPGEKITKELLEWTAKIVNQGFHLQGALDDRNTVIKVVK